MKKLGEFDDELTYSVAEDLVNPGNFVSVLMRNKPHFGIVTSCSEELADDLELSKIKPINQVIESVSLSGHQLKLARFISSYYRTSMARALRLFIPRKMWQGNLDEPVSVYYEAMTDEPGRLGAKQAILFNLLSSAGKPLSHEELVKTDGYSPASLATLVKKGVITKTACPRFSLPADSSEIQFDKRLTKDQTEAASQIHESKRPILLHGVTGSGKTEVYLRLIAEALDAGKQALLLLPEIALTPQMIQYFESYFKGCIALFHSKLSDTRRLEEWWKVKKRTASLVIGSRSAVFAPLCNPGLIILDEEHEWTYKQESSPYYLTHRVAEELSGLTGAKLVFGSATPKAETYQKAKSKEYQLVELPKRVNERPMPGIQVVDLREEFKKRNFSIFSDLLRQKIEGRLQKHEQIILFVNQRGHSSAVLCRDCGYTEKCPNCDISLKLHYSFRESGIRNQESAKYKSDSRLPTPDSQLKCHYCDFSKQPEIVCPECRSPYIKHVGVGTQKVEQEVRKNFPGARVVRADSDTVKASADFESVYHSFQSQEYDILIGTQMVAKGLDFPQVTLIGIVLADIGLHIPDFRSSERLFQLVTQVAGRCGRSEKAGEVVLQTYNPDHPAFEKASRYAYSEFMDTELKFREKLSYPPYNKMVKFTVVGSDERRLAEHIEQEQELLEDIFKVNQLPVKVLSAPAMIPRMGGRYYYHVLIRAENPFLLFEHWKPPRGWRVDVDPVNTA